MCDIVFSAKNGLINCGVKDFAHKSVDLNVSYSVNLFSELIACSGLENVH